MKKQKLNFSSEGEFQSFFAQLSSAELSNFQAVEGAGGDKGFDGLSNKTAYQAYYPEEKNRKDSKYIAKINEDLKKVQINKKKLGLEINEWIFVVPEDLRIDVVAHLTKKSKETGINCKYWGATKLLELVTKYPHVQDSFPSIFLPPVRDKIEEIDRKIFSKQEAKVSDSTDFITDHEYFKQKREIEGEYREKIEELPVGRHGQVLAIYADQEMKHRKAADVKIADLDELRSIRDKAYNLELEELNEAYDEMVDSINNDMARRGLSSSGIKDRAISRLEKKRQRAIEKLKIKFGKTGGYLSIVE